MERQIKPSDRKATCLLAEGKQITLTGEGSKHATAASGIYPLDSGAQRFEKSGAEMCLSKKMHLESVSVKRIRDKQGDVG